MSYIPPYDTDIDFRDKIPFLTTLEHHDDELADDKNYGEDKEVLQILKNNAGGQFEKILKTKIKPTKNRK